MFEKLDAKVELKNDRPRGHEPTGRGRRNDNGTSIRDRSALAGGGVRLLRCSAQRGSDRCAAPADRRRALDCRHGGAAQGPRVGRGQGPGQPVEPGVPARRLDAGHRASRPVARDPRRRAGPDARLGRSGGEGAAPERPDGRRPAPALRREPVDLLDVQQAPGRRHAGHGAGAREATTARR